LNVRPIHSWGNEADGIGLRESVSVENTQLESRLAGLEGELRDLKEKDRLQLQETKTYVVTSTPWFD
jgi:hypothetical protein